MPLAYPLLNGRRMDVSLYQAAAAMNATAHWQEMISDNIAQAQVPGGRKQVISFSDIQAGYQADASGSIQSSYYIPVAHALTNFHPGELHRSGSTMDFALEGPGFFSVQLTNGETGYTRDGQFHLNAQGQLVNKQGLTVLGTGGPLQFDPNNRGTITISPGGDVSQGGEVKGKLAVVEAKTQQQLTALGGGLYYNTDLKNPPAAAASTQVRQGFVEASNTSPTVEMANLITAMRMFDSNQKVLQMENDRMGKTINDLAGTQ